MKPADTGCTILIVGDPQAAPIRMRLSRRLIKGALAFAGGLLLVELALLFQVTTHIKELGERHVLRSEIADTQERKAALLAEMAEVKRQVLAVKHLNWRFSVMLGQEEAQAQPPAFGKGGEESPLDTTVGLEREIQWLKEEAASQETLLKKHVTLAQEKSARWASTPTIWPVKGPITSGFGARLSPFSGEPAQHHGLDIGAAIDTPVVAPAGGTVVAVKHDPNMGNVVKIDHGFALLTEYHHLSRALVQEGQPIRRGETLGLVGNTGLLSTGPHLHYQVMVNERPVNPQDYLLEIE